MTKAIAPQEISNAALVKGYTKSVETVTGNMVSLQIRNAHLEEQIEQMREQLLVAQSTVDSLNRSNADLNKKLDDTHMEVVRLRFRQVNQGGLVSIDQLKGLLAPMVDGSMVERLSDSLSSVSNKYDEENLDINSNDLRTVGRAKQRLMEITRAQGLEYGRAVRADMTEELSALRECILNTVFPAPIEGQDGATAECCNGESAACACPHSESDHADDENYALKA
jgi:hypothetical protein